MAHPSKPGADDAYARALAAYEEKSYEVARRWVLEALAHDRQHAGARALLTRLDAARQPSRPLEPAHRGSEVVSVDPTVLVSRANAPEPVEPTVMVQRDEPRRRLSDTDTHEIIRPSRRTTARPVPEPTAIVQPKKRTAPSRLKSSTSLLASIGASVRTWFPAARGSAGRTPAHDRSAVDRHSGVLIAFATFAVGALLVWAAFLAVRWVWPAGQLLTVNKPTGGTIVGPGIECGTQGSKCSTRVATGETVELEARPDNGYAFTAFTGDCAPMGRPFMTEARTCGATFGAVAAAAAPVTFRLTIQKPEGGTVVGPSGILCGALGNTCSADVPSGVPVTLRPKAEDGFTWEQFTGDCPASGETTMTGAMTCGATFIPTSAPLANRGPDRGPIAPPRPRPRPADPPKPARPTAQPPAAQNPSPPPSAGTPAPTPTTAEAPTVAPEKPVARPQTAEEHAKDEINQLVKEYCQAYQTLQPARIQKVFPLINQAVLKDQFRQYKSLQCMVTSPPEFDRLDASAAGGAQLKVGIKQVIVMRSGGAPQTSETIVTMVVSRQDFQSPWLIDRVKHEAKPKS